jgi:hypothetical protein
MATASGQWKMPQAGDTNRKYEYTGQHSAVKALQYDKSLT